MGKFNKALNKAAKAFRDNKFGEFMAGNKKIECPHCGSVKFAEGNAQLNTAGLTFLGLDWANKTATTLACENCGNIQWFLERPERI